MKPYSEVVKLVARIVADETLDAGGILRVRDSELLHVELLVTRAWLATRECVRRWEPTLVWQAALPC